MYVLESPQEAMEDQIKILRLIDQENLDTRPWVMKIIDQIVSAQPWLIPKVNRALTHAKFYEYCYARLMRGTSAEETLQDKEVHERMAAIHGSTF